MKRNDNRNFGNANLCAANVMLKIETAAMSKASTHFKEAAGVNNDAMTAGHNSEALGSTNSV
jgi:hypothetical protein